MNAYWIDAGKIQYDHDYETDYYEDEQACGIYFGSTRGQAKVQFLNEYARLEFIDPMRIRLLAKNITSLNQLTSEQEAWFIGDFDLWNKVQNIIDIEGYFKA